MPATPESRRRMRFVRAVAAGLVIATGIGLGAFNAWWVALVVGVPLVFVGLLISPRPSRVSELPEFRRGVTRDAPQADVEALTRSSLTAEDLQPTMVSATIHLPNDTSYRARWLTAMGKGHFEALSSSPRTTLAPAQVPPRDPSATPRFDDHPGRWAVIYPAVTFLSTCALLFGVAENWEVSLPSFPSIDSVVGGVGGGDDAAPASLAARHQRLLDAIVEYEGPSAVRNVLRLNYSLGSSSDQAVVFDPSNGRATSINVYSGGSNSSAVPNLDRADKTFDAAEIDPTSLGEIAGAMVSEVAGMLPEATLERLSIQRPQANAPVTLTGTLDPGDAFIRDVDIQAHTDGTVAKFFDPGDFAVAFAVGRDALAAARIAPNAPVLDGFVLRGIADNTPIISASSIQNSGGVLFRYTTPDRTGQIVVAPGRFPEISTTTGRFRNDHGLAFDALSPQLFDRIRDDSMRRGSIPAYDRNAVTIDVTDVPTTDADHVIRIEMARVDASKGMYTLDGRFIKPAHY
ncbi:hypothetical protein [Gordonia paraffinivorans]|uniref:hypothetical protein n=1 Tax=Gordonia paraffinivorans TaxID=175628 RepID=UPI0014469CCF|nr:hypothetical protein [Gordonia paraffinivorans]